MALKVQGFLSPPPPPWASSNHPFVNTVSYGRMDQIAHRCSILTNDQYTLITSDNIQTQVYMVK